VNDKKNKIDFITFLKGFFMGLFPSFIILGTNSGLSKCAEINKKDKYFGRQMLKNYFLAFLLFGVSIGSMIMAKERLMADRVIAQKINELSSIVKSKKVVGLPKIVKDIVGYENTKNVLKEAGAIFAIPFLLSAFIVFSHPIISRNRKLKRAFKRNGVLNDKDEPIEGFYTPKGVLVYMSGQDPKELSKNDRIWSSINTRLASDEWSEDEMNRQIVFLHASFNLKNKYQYTLE